jgi:hypothetical protein
MTNNNAQTGAECPECGTTGLIKTVTAHAGDVTTLAGELLKPGDLFRFCEACGASLIKLATRRTSSPAAAKPAAKKPAARRPAAKRAPQAPKRPAAKKTARPQAAKRGRGKR